MRKLITKPLKNNGEPCWVRTSDLLIKSPQEIACFQRPFRSVRRLFANAFLRLSGHCRNELRRGRSIIPHTPRGVSLT